MTEKDGETQAHLPVLNPKMLDKKEKKPYLRASRYQAQNKGKPPGTINEERS